MRSVIRWAVRNTPAMNTLMIGIIGVGVVGVTLLHRELFPEFNLEIIQITVPYPGASPAEVEEGICQKVEEAVQSVSGIKKLSSIAEEGSGTVVLELETSVDVQKTLNEVRSEVDRISSFPELAEDPEVKQITLRRAAIRVGVVGPELYDADSEFTLRQVAERVREALLLLPSVSQANILDGRSFEIDVEISEDTLRKYGLTLQQVANIIRRQNVELPGGTIRADSQEILIRGKGKYLTGVEIAKLPVLTLPDGVVLTVGDLGNVHDGFADTTMITRINQRPGVVISVDKTADEDLLAICREVHEFLDSVNTPDGLQLPPGYELVHWLDESVPVAGRLRLLTKNGIQGLILVFLLLTIFLELRLAFWVAMGLPVAMLGTCAVLYGMGQSLNMLSMFAFLIGLGILVDDAIVVGENIYTHRRFGKSLPQAAVDGAFEVLPSVSASVSTTIIAFVPMLFVPGVMGKFFAIVPTAIITMLVLSWVESLLILPCHLGHDPTHGRQLGRKVLQASCRVWNCWPLWITVPATVGSVALIAGHWSGYFHSLLAAEPLGTRLLGFLAYAGWIPAVAVLTVAALFLFSQFVALTTVLNRGFARGFDWFLGHLYRPSVHWAVRRPYLVSAAASAVLLVVLGLVKGGYFAFTPFPKLDSNYIYAEIVFPDGTPAHVTDQATERLEQAIWQVNDQLAPPGKSLVRVTHRAVGTMNVSGEITGQIKPAGSQAGAVFVELAEASERDITSIEIMNRWREVAGQFPGVESLSFHGANVGPGGTPIEFALLATPEHWEAVEKAAELCKAKLREYPGVFDIADDSRPGKWEFQLTLKDRAKALGITLADVSETVRAAIYGQEVMRLQRGRHEVKLMVRYPPDERYSPFNLSEIRVSGPDGIERPLPELADVKVRRGYSAIFRTNQMRSITITADVAEEVANAQKIINVLRNEFLPELLSRPEFRRVYVRWEGQQEETNEAVTGLTLGLMLALVAMFALLTVEFCSYAQPLLIMVIIPFGLIGAVFGHWVMGLDLTLISLFGIVALTGVVINDSIVLIDFINHRVRNDVDVDEALVESGCRRLRPILLTSLTTIAGLTPLLVERSFQAQVLIPMATSLCFGLMFTTVLVPILVPAFYKIYYEISGFLSGREATPPEEPPADGPTAAQLASPVEEALAR